MMFTLAQAPSSAFRTPSRAGTRARGGALVAARASLAPSNDGRGSPKRVALLESRRRLPSSKPGARGRGGAVRPARAAPVCAPDPGASPSTWASALAALPAALEQNLQEFAVAAAVVAFALTAFPALARRAWEVVHTVTHRADGATFLFPVRSFSVADAELGGKLRSKSRELASFETSAFAAAVAPATIAVTATVVTRLLTVTGFSNVLFEILYARVGCVVHTWKLPWPVYVASAWWFMDGAVRNAKNRALAAVDEVRGARALEPRIVTSASTARTFLALPMILLWLDTVGVTLSSVWGLLGFGGVAVSLGLKDLVADFIAGLTMLTNPTFKVGDNIKAGAVMGTVMGIGATKTTLLTRTGTGKTPHTISNNVLSSHSAGLVNMSLSRARYFDHEICVDAKSMAAVEKLCADISAYLVSHPLVILDPMDSGEKPWCALSKLGPHGVLIGVKCCLRKMGGQAFALEQGRMLLAIGKIVEANQGVELSEIVGYA
jgi:hypothetical protein